MTPLDRILDGLEAAWTAAADLDPYDRPEGLSYLLWQAGQFIEQHRPGLVDRLLAGINNSKDHHAP